MTSLYILIGAVVLVGVFLILTYNGMIGARNRVDEAWAGIDVQLRRRHDLIPNLVETVKGYATHEREVMERVTEARARAMGAQGPASSGPAESALGAALGRLMAVAEAYPQLRANENFLALQQEISNTENQIAASRRIYNGNVQSYNTKIQVFPNSVIASTCSFTPRDYFELEEGAPEREPVAVSFG
jgi:LemA protein